MISILTIGNSLSDNATLYLEKLAEARDIELVIGKVNPGGCSLEKHWNMVEQCELIKEVKPYNFYMTGSGVRRATLKEALTSGRWNYVTLQQVSGLSWKVETFHPYIEKLYDLVGELAPQAQRLIYQTWANRCDSDELRNFGISQEKMFTCIKQTFDNVSKKLGCRVIPCGEAFQKARSLFNYIPDKNYDFEHPKPLELPEQSKSLTVGYHWITGNTDTGKAELHLDGIHGNAKGCYLLNAVWYEMFTKNSVLDNDFCPEGVCEKELDILKNIAHETVMKYEKET